MLPPFGDNLDYMAVEKVLDLSPLEWVLRKPMAVETAKPWPGVRVDRCLPAFEAYVKVLHPIWLTEAGRGPKEPSRILWVDLARRNGLQFHSEMNANYFHLASSGRELGGDIQGPDEGRLDDVTCQAILESIRSIKGSEQCLFYYSGIGPPHETTLYKGFLEDVLLCFKLDGIRALPEYWWPENRTWCVCTDRDLCFTLIGGATDLVRSIMQNPFLECLPVSGESRVDWYADVPNFRTSVRQLAERILNGSISVSLGARAMVMLRSMGCEERDLSLSVFSEISRATDAIPLGPERQYWSAALLAKKDAELRRIESDYRTLVWSTCREILANY